jgi:hypothetical protein
MAESIPTVDELMETAFKPGREPRSAEYKRGVHDMLVRRIEGIRLPIPYDQASAQRDAYYSGWDEADAIWHALQDTQTNKIVSRDSRRPPFPKSQIVCDHRTT